MFSYITPLWKLVHLESIQDFPPYQRLVKAARRTLLTNRDSGELIAAMTEILPHFNAFAFDDFSAYGGMSQEEFLQAADSVIDEIIPALQYFSRHEPLGSFQVACELLCRDYSAVSTQKLLDFITSCDIRKIEEIAKDKVNLLEVMAPLIEDGERTNTAGRMAAAFELRKKMVSIKDFDYKPFAARLSEDAFLPTSVANDIPGVDDHTLPALKQLLKMGELTEREEEFLLLDPESIAEKPPENILSPTVAMSMYFQVNAELGHRFEDPASFIRDIMYGTPLEKWLLRIVFNVIGKPTTISFLSEELKALRREWIIGIQMNYRARAVLSLPFIKQCKRVRESLGDQDGELCRTLDRLIAAHYAAADRLAEQAYSLMDNLSPPISKRIAPFTQGTSILSCIVRFATFTDQVSPAAERAARKFLEVLPKIKPYLLKKQNGVLAARYRDVNLALACLANTLEGGGHDELLQQVLTNLETCFDEDTNLFKGDELVEEIVRARSGGDVEALLIRLYTASMEEQIKRYDQEGILRNSKVLFSPSHPRQKCVQILNIFADNPDAQHLCQVATAFLDRIDKDMGRRKVQKSIPSSWINLVLHGIKISNLLLMCCVHRQTFPMCLGLKKIKRDLAIRRAAINGMLIPDRLRVRFRT